MSGYNLIRFLSWITIAWTLLFGTQVCSLIQNVFKLDNQSRPDIQNNHQLPPTTNTQNVLESISVSTEDVNSVLSTLSTDKGTGLDEISARLLKECVNEIASSLTALFNKSLSLGKVPQEWKEAKTLLQLIRKIFVMLVTTDQSRGFLLCRNL